MGVHIPITSLTGRTAQRGHQHWERRRPNMLRCILTFRCDLGPEDWQNHLGNNVGNKLDTHISDALKPHVFTTVSEELD